MNSVRRNPLNGRITMVASHSNEDANTQEVSASWYWSSTEGSRYGSWYVGFSSGYTYGNAKYGGYRARAVAAFTFKL